MSIAIIAWGSVVWDRQGLPISGDWQNDGPILPIEFSRVSKDARLTLVIDETNGVPVKTKYAISSRSSIDEAINDLRMREGTSVKHIGWVNFVDVAYSTQTYPEQASVQSEIATWNLDKDFDGVVWTALPPSFDKKCGVPFSVESAVKYITSLPRNVRHEALRYIGNAPISVETPFRRKIKEMQEAVRKSDEFLQKINIRIEAVLRQLQHEQSPVKAGLIVKLDGHDVTVGEYDPVVGLWTVFRGGISIKVKTPILETAYRDSVGKEITTPTPKEYLSKFRPKNTTDDEENTFERR